MEMRTFWCCSRDEKTLSSLLDDWLSKASKNGHSARALIAPHAGYTYCGACAAHAYKQINPENIKRIFILGPSHHVPLPGCALTQTHTYETPLYDLKIDLPVVKELLNEGVFDLMSIQSDEDEHSIELHLPYIAKAMESKRGEFTIVPILVGGTDQRKEEAYGKIFSKYLADPENFFVISSDFCHWGKRFRFTYHDTSKEVYQSIEDLDRMGMDAIEHLDVKGFYSYLKKYSNTICGRHPIGIFLNAVRALPSNLEASFKFHCYAQSNKCRSVNDSSVSYAAGTLSIN